MTAPKRGDVLFERARPCVVVSHDAYNARSNLVIVCPMTSRRKGRTFEVPTEFQGVEGAVLVDQVRSIDRVTRRLRPAGSLDAGTMDEILARLRALVQ